MNSKIIAKIKAEVVARKVEHLREVLILLNASGFDTTEIEKEILFNQEIYALRMWDYISLATRNREGGLYV